MKWLVANGSALLVAALACAAASFLAIQLAPLEPSTLTSVAQDLSARGTQLTLDERLQAEANRLSLEANALSYRQAIAAAIGAATALVTLISAIVAALYAKRAAEQTRRSADIAQAALLASERAWINVDLAVQEPLQFSPLGDISVRVGIEIKNVGKTPAINVHTNVDIILDYESVSEKIKAFASKSRIVNIQHSRLLLPGQSYVRPWVPSVMSDDRLGGHLLPIVIGCVTYQVIPDLSLHQTAFSFMLSVKNKDGASSGLFRNNVMVPAERILVEGTNGGFAN